VRYGTLVLAYTRQRLECTTVPGNCTIYNVTLCVGLLTKAAHRSNIGRHIIHMSVNYIHTGIWYLVPQPLK